MSLYETLKEYRAVTWREYIEWLKKEILDEVAKPSDYAIMDSNERK